MPFCFGVFLLESVAWTSNSYLPGRSHLHGFCFFSSLLVLTGYKLWCRLLWQLTPKTSCIRHGIWWSEGYTPHPRSPNRITFLRTWLSYCGAILPVSFYDPPTPSSQPSALPPMEPRTVDRKSVFWFAQSVRFILKALNSTWKDVQSSDLATITLSWIRCSCLLFHTMLRVSNSRPTCLHK